MKDTEEKSQIYYAFKRIWVRKPRVKDCSSTVEITTEVIEEFEECIDKIDEFDFTITSNYQKESNNYNTQNDIISTRTKVKKTTREFITTDEKRTKIVIESEETKKNGEVISETETKTKTETFKQSKFSVRKQKRIQTSRIQAAREKALEISDTQMISSEYL